MVATTRFTGPAISPLPHVTDTHVTPTLPVITHGLTSPTRHYAQRGCRGGDPTPGNPVIRSMFSPLTAEPGTWRRLALAILDRCRAPIFTPTFAESPAWPQGPCSARGRCD